MKARGVPTTKPKIFRNDRWEIRVYINDGIIKFYPLRITLGEILPDRRPKFTFRVKDFIYYKNEFRDLVEIMDLWKEKLL